MRKGKFSKLSESTKMRRRDFLKTLVFGIISCGFAPKLMAQRTTFEPGTFTDTMDDYIRDYLHKMKFFNQPHKDDIYVERSLYDTFKSAVLRLRRLERFVGHGNYQILSLDEGLRTGHNYPQVGEFSRDEADYLEMIFYSEARYYGFFGRKPLKKITDRINEKEVTKVPYTGNYIYKGEPYETYVKIKKQIGDQAVLTSGVRGVMKQFLLFLNKAFEYKGNLSLASRSLAPPGYSFHGNGDFDVGQSGFGAANFTEHFTDTEVYRRLCDLGYLKLRYPQQNLLGVRFEPWHIKII